MEENENGFKSVPVDKTHKSNFSKAVLVPFISGIIGATLVIGVCFGVPTIKNKLFNGTNLFSAEGSPSSNVNNEDNTDPSKINATAISLEGYSETAMGVADKVLPSIVGIEIEYNISSFFGMSTNTATGSGIIISEDRIHSNK